MASNSDNGFFRLLSVAPRPRELTGAVDLISHYGLREQYDTFCRKPLPASIADSHFLSNVVGDTELRRGEGMELGQLLEGGAASMPVDHVPFQPFDLEVMRRAFTLKEAGPISLPESERGLPTISSRGIGDQDDSKKKKKHRSKDKDKHRSKDRDKDREKDKDKEKKKDRDKDKVRDKDKDKDRAKGENGEDRKKHRKKKRRHEGQEEEADGHKHKSKSISTHQK